MVSTPAAGPCACERDEAIALRGFVAVEQTAVGDGIEQHLKVSVKAVFTRPVINWIVRWARTSSRLSTRRGFSF